MLFQAAILQRTVEYISQLLQERQKILKHLDELNGVKILKMSDTKDDELERSTFSKLQVANGACLPTQSCFVGSYNGVVSSVPGGRELEVQNVCINNSQQSVRISLPLGVSNQIQSQVLPIHLEAMETDHHREEVVSSSPSSDFNDGGSCNIGNLDVILRAIHSIEGMDSNEESNDESEQDSESDYAIALVHWFVLLSVLFFFCYFFQCK